MSKKRFTDCDKWDDPWFADLDDRMKLLWGYLCDRCDAAGVWVVNHRLARFHLGWDIDVAAALAALGDRVELIDGGRKWNLRKFVRFQYPVGLKRECHPHKVIARLLEGHGLPVPWGSDSSPSRTLPTTVVTTDKDTDKDKDKDKERDKDKETRSAAAVLTKADPGENLIDPPAEPPTETDDRLVEIGSRVMDWRNVKDQERTAQNRDTLIFLMRDQKGRRFVLDTAERLRRAIGRKPWPNEVEHEVGEARRAASEASADPIATRIADLVARHGWEACRAALPFAALVKNRHELEAALGQNLEMIDHVAAALGGGAVPA